MPDESNQIKRNDIRAVDLLTAFIAFFMLSAFFAQLFGFKEAFSGWKIIFLMGINYFPLLLFPYLIASKYHNVIQILGLSRENFIKTAPYGIVAFLISGIWQTGFLGFSDITLYPDWVAYANPIAVLVILLLPLLEMKYNRGKWIIPGFITLIAWAVYAYLLPSGDEDMSQAVMDACQNPWMFALISFLLGVFVPFAEEFFFRGFVLRGFLGSFSPYVAILITGTLFGFAHFGMTGIITLALFSLPIGLFTWRTKSIYPAIWAHAGLNLSGMVLVFYQMQLPG
jgi:membrane protease YdiL (CAAX protease family)